MYYLSLICGIYEFIRLVIIIFNIKFIIFNKSCFSSMNYILRLQLSFFQGYFKVAIVVADASFVDFLTTVNTFVFCV